MNAAPACTHLDLSDAPVVRVDDEECAFAVTHDAEWPAE